MIVIIPIADGPNMVYTKTISIRDYCPKCGEKRGIPVEKGEHRISIWTNPCGHRDTYEGALYEYMRRTQFEHRGRGDKYEPTIESIFNFIKTIKQL
jgi:Zn-finger nucleic acid-binding protein